MNNSYCIKQTSEKVSTCCAGSNEKQKITHEKGCNSIHKFSHGGIYRQYTYIVEKYKIYLYEL